MLIAVTYNIATYNINSDKNIYIYIDRSDLVSSNTAALSLERVYKLFKIQPTLQITDICRITKQISDCIF